MRPVEAGREGLVTMSGPKSGQIERRKAPAAHQRGPNGALAHRLALTPLAEAVTSPAAAATLLASARAGGRAAESVRQRAALALQRYGGNRAVQRAVSAPAAAAPGEGRASASPITPAVEAQMRADVEQIVALLRQQWMNNTDERVAVSYLRKWDRQGPAFLDRFVLLLQMRSFARRRARNAWIEQHALVYDDLWRDLEGDRLEEFKALVAKSKHHTAGPALEQEESAWSYVGKREAIGFWGVLKGLGTTLTGAVDTAVWAYWRTSGLPLYVVLKKFGVKEESLYLTPFVSKSFDETADILSKELGVDKNEVLFAGIGTYQFGEAGGKVVGALTMAGATATAGQAGGAAKAATQAYGIASAGRATEGLILNIRQLRQPPPEGKGLTWSQIAQRADVWAQVVGVVGSAVGAAGGFSEATTAVGQALKDLGMALNANQVALLLLAWQQVDADPTLTPEQKGKAKADILADIVSTGALMVNEKYGDRFNKWMKDRKAGAGGEAELPKGAEEALPEADLRSEASTEGESKLREMGATAEQAKDVGTTWTPDEMKRFSEDYMVKGFVGGEGVAGRTEEKTYLVRIGEAGEGKGAGAWGDHLFPDLKSAQQYAEWVAATQPEQAARASRAIPHQWETGDVSRFEAVKIFEVPPGTAYWQGVVAPQMEAATRYAETSPGMTAQQVMAAGEKAVTLPGGGPQVLIDPDVRGRLQAAPFEQPLRPGGEP